MDIEVSACTTGSATHTSKVITLQTKKRFRNDKDSRLRGGISSADASWLVTDSSVMDAATLTRAFRQDPNRRFIVSFDNGKPYLPRSSC